MAAFATWLLGFAKAFLTWLYNYGIDLLQGAIDGFVDFIISIAQIWPDGPNLPAPGDLLPTGEPWIVFLKALNWVFPLQYLGECLGFIATAIVSYLVIAPLARWLKLLT